MTDPTDEHARLLADARRREDGGWEVMAPASLDPAIIYGELMSKALDLAKLIATETRDLEAIRAHYEIEVARIDAGFRTIEAFLAATLEQDRSLREKSFETINLLIAQGQHALALKFYEKLVDGSRGGGLEALVDFRNQVASQSATRWTLR